MTKDPFDLRNISSMTRFRALRAYHYFRVQSDWAVVYWEAGDELEGDKSFTLAHSHLNTYLNLVHGNKELSVYVQVVHDRWAAMVNREQWITEKIEELKTNTPRY